MREYVITTPERLRKVCINHHWFTCGDCDQYNKLFLANSNPDYSIVDIATIIWICSEEEFFRRDIIDCLIDERQKYLAELEVYSK